MSRPSTKRPAGEAAESAPQRPRASPSAPFRPPALTGRPAPRTGAWEPTTPLVAQLSEVDASDWLRQEPSEHCRKRHQFRQALERLRSQAQALLKEISTVECAEAEAAAAAGTGEANPVVVGGLSCDGPNSEKAELLNPSAPSAVRLVKAFLDVPDNGEYARVLYFDGASTGPVNTPASEVLRRCTRFVSCGEGSPIDAGSAVVCGTAVVGTEYE